MNIKNLKLLIMLAFCFQINITHCAAGEQKESDRSSDNRKRKNDDENSSRKKETSSRDDVIDSLRKISSLRQGFDLVGLSYDNFLDGQDVFIPEVDKDHNNDEMSVQMMILDAMNSVTEKAESIIVEDMSLLLKKSFNDAIDSQTNLDDLGMRLYSYAIGRKFSFGKFILQAMDMPRIFLQSAFYNNIQIVKLIIEGGIDVNVWHGGSTALMVAAQNGYTEVVRILIDAGAEINRQTDRGFTALIVAAQHGRAEVVRILIDAGADFNRLADTGFTALMIAAQFGQAVVVQLLINAGADINRLLDREFTVLMIAARSGRAEVVQVLIDTGVDINIQTAAGHTALMFAAQHRHKEVVHSLIDAGADINTQTDEGVTVLMMAVEDNYADLVRQLILAGANADLINNEGQTAFDLADEEMRVVIQDAIARR